MAAILNDLTVMHCRVRHLVTPHQLVTTVNIHVVLVSVVALAVLLCPPRIRILLGTPGRVVFPALRRLTFLDLCVLITAVALFGNRDDRSVDNLATHRQITLFFQIAVEVLKQGFDHPSVSQLFPVHPYRLGVRDFILKTQTQKPDEGKAVAKLIFNLVIRQVVKSTKNNRLEHHNSVPGLAPRIRLALLGRLAPCRFQANTEAFPRNNRIDLHQRVVLGVQTRISVGDVEKTHLSHFLFP